METTATEDARLDRVFTALASTTRRRILSRLAEGEATVNELAEPFALSLPAVSKHIKVLERAGLVVGAGTPSTARAPSTPPRSSRWSTWAEQYRPVWEHRFDRMAEHLARLQHQDPRGDHDA